MDLPIGLELHAHGGHELEVLTRLVDRLFGLSAHRHVCDLDSLPGEHRALLAPEVHAHEVRDFFDLHRVTRDDLEVKRNLVLAAVRLRGVDSLAVDNDRGLLPNLRALAESHHDAGKRAHVRRVPPEVNGTNRGYWEAVV